jgi:flavin-binding protein dodecin
LRSLVSHEGPEVGAGLQGRIRSKGRYRQLALSIRRRAAEAGTGWRSRPNDASPRGATLGQPRKPTHALGFEWFATLDAQAPGQARHARSIKGGSVSDHIYRVTEIVGSSPDGVDQAIRNAVTRASQTLRNLEWFEVVEVRGHLSEGQVAHVQVTMKVGFRLDEQ